MFHEARILVLSCAILICLIVLARGAFAQSTPTLPLDMKNVTVQARGVAVIAPVTVNAPKPIVIPAPEVRFAPTIEVRPADVKIPDELNIRTVGETDVRVRGQLDITSMPAPPQPQSWCVRNLGWCGLIGAAIVGASVGIADSAGAFDSTVSFK